MLFYNKLCPQEQWTIKNTCHSTESRTFPLKKHSTQPTFGIAAFMYDHNHSIIKYITCKRYRLEGCCLETDWYSVWQKHVPPGRFPLLNLNWTAEFELCILTFVFWGVNKQLLLAISETVWNFKHGQGNPRKGDFPPPNFSFPPKNHPLSIAVRWQFCTHKDIVK